MDASRINAQRDVALETIKRDVVALQNALDDVRQQSATAVKRQISEQPFQSVALAFAAGFVISRILSGRLF